MGFKYTYTKVERNTKLVQQTVYMWLLLHLSYFFMNQQEIRNHTIGPVEPLLEDSVLIISDISFVFCFDTIEYEKIIIFLVENRITICYCSNCCKPLHDCTNGHSEVLSAVVKHQLLESCLIFSWYSLPSSPELKNRTSAVKPGQSVGTPAIGGPFKLLNHEGKPVTEKDFLGKWTLLYFGFTHCPDICPDELQKMAAAIDKISMLIWFSCSLDTNNFFFRIDTSTFINHVLTVYCLYQYIPVLRVCITS